MKMQTYMSSFFIKTKISYFLDFVCNHKFLYESRKRIAVDKMFPFN